MVSRERWETVREIYDRAVELPPARWEAFLDAACGDEEELRSEVGTLLEAYRTREGFLDGPTLEPRQEWMRQPASLDPECGSFIDRYKLLQKIGEGGFGVVYMAEQREPVVRKIAVKIIKLGLDTKQVIARFEAERQALAMMDHPNIARVLDAGATGSGRPYFVMELVRGSPITTHCDVHRLNTAERLELFIDVCGAIQHAHQKGVIHRDIKPSNVMITMHDDKAVVKVIDFGIAKATQHRLTEKTLFTEYRQFIGTPAYMSPEQAQMSGLDTDTRSDIYSLGVLLYELLTGRTPFDSAELARGSHDEICRRIREEEPPRPSTRLSTLGRAELSDVACARRVAPDKLGNSMRRDLDWVVMKALEKDRSRRYATASDFARDIRRFLDHEPVTAVAPSSIYRFRRFARRNRSALVTGIAILASLVGATAISSWQALRALEAREEAELGREREAALRIRAEDDRERARAEEREHRLIAYAADMRLAQVALDEHNIGRVRRSLERHVPPPGGEDLRGLEWCYLWQASEGQEIDTFSHASKVSGLAVSARLVATLGLDGRIRVFSLDSRRLIEEIDCDGLPVEDRGALGFSRDGDLLAAATGNGVTLWSTRDFRRVRTLEDGSAPIAFSPDGTMLAAIAADGIRIWDTVSWHGRTVAAGRDIRPRSFQCLSFSPDSSTLAFARGRPVWNTDSRLEIWDVDSGERTAVLEGPVTPVAVAFSDDGSRLAAGFFEGEVGLWDLESTTLLASFRAHPGVVFGITFIPGKRLLATGGSDQLIRLWDSDSYRELGSLQGHGSEIWNLRALPDGRRLASTSKDGTAKLWNLERSRTRSTVHALPDRMVDAGFDASGKGLLLRGGDCETLLLDLASGKLEDAFAFSADGSLDGCRDVVLSADRMLRIQGRDDGTIVVTDARGSRVIAVGSERVEPKWISSKKTYALLFCHDGRRFLLWDIERGEVLSSLPDQAERFKAVISPDERRLAHFGHGHSVEIRELPSMERGPTLGAHTWMLKHLGFSPSGELLASSDEEGVVRIWDVERGVEVVPPIRGHFSGVRRVDFSRDGRTLVTTGAASVRFWSVATGREMLRFPDTLGCWFTPVMSPDGRALVWTAFAGAVEVTAIPTLGDIDRDRHTARAEPQR